MKAILLEALYILAGLVSIITAVYAIRDKKHPHPKATALFWFIFGALFIFGKYVPGYVVGVLILVEGVLTASKKVCFGSQQNAEEKIRLERSEKLRNKIFIPAVTIGVVAFAVAQLLPSLGGLVGLGAGAIVASLIAKFMTGSKGQHFAYDGSRLLQQIGSASILPQLLAALGALFAAAGVGEVIASGIGSFLVQGNVLGGVIAYCLGMAIFTMIMGNAFAAFAVITVGIGIPFVYSQGANAAIAGSLALTAGYCGTLMTPMAANFNIVPAAILETKNSNRVIIAQVPIAIALLLTHIVLMYTLAF